VAMLMSLCMFLQMAGQATAGGRPPEKINLDQAVAEAQAHNLEFLAAQARLPIADARIITAGLRPHPTLNVTADHLDALGARFSELNGGGPSEYAVSTDFTWERAGKRMRRIAVAAKERTIGEFELLDALRRLTFEVQSAFLDAMVSQENLRVARENLASMARIAEINMARVAAGDLSEVELKRSQLAALQLENTLSQAELALRNAEDRLCLLMGRKGSSDPIEVAGEFRHEAHLVSLATVENMALDQRPDLKATLAEEERAAADVLLQTAISHADVEVGTEYRRQQGVNGVSNSLGFTFSVPLPFCNRNQGELARARAEVNLAARKSAAMRASILTEVRVALDQQATARRQLDRIESSMLAQAREVRDITQYAYQRGEASFVELLDAERAYMETMQGYTMARAEYSRSLYLIDAVSGKGGQR
jgi:cobalt-zinc-cadmium efflux system outer membrane protein